MKRRTRNDDTEGWTSGGDLADVEEIPRSRGEVPIVQPPHTQEIINDIDIRSSKNLPSTATKNLKT